jgi:ankyrin repeat protein
VRSGGARPGHSREKGTRIAISSGSSWRGWGTHARQSNRSDLGAIARLLAEQPGLARARFVAPDGGSGTALHMVADWPGYFSNGPEVVELLIGADDIDEAFWQACHGGQRRMAEYLLARGANINARPDYARQTPLQVATDGGTQRQALAEWLREHGATDD